MSHSTSIVTDSHLELLGPGWRDVVPIDRDDLQEAIEMLPWIREMAEKIGQEIELRKPVTADTVKKEGE